MRSSSVAVRGQHSTSLCVLLGAALLLLTAFNDASAAPRRASMVIDANTGKVLHASQADALRHPASLTKLMTLYLVFEEIERGRISLSTNIRVSQRAASAPPSKLGLKVGETISVSDAIKALTVKSANDVAVAIAEHIGGSEEEFARMMTEKARLLGMSNTTFRNASGLPNVEQVTTARDMLTLALRLQDDFPQHYHFFSLKTFSYKGRTYRTHNSLLRTFAGMDGLKTGYIRMSGFNLVSSVRRGGRRVVAVVFGGTTAASRNAEMRALLNRTIPKASTKRTRTPAPVAFYRPPPPVPARRPAASVTQSPVPAASSWSQPSISVAKVRPVMVVPPKSAQPAAPEPPGAKGEGGQQLSITSAALGLAPSTLQQQAANLAQGLPPLSRVSAYDQAGEQHSLPRVTKAALHAEAPSSPEPAAAVPNSTPATAKRAGTYQVQIGAYSSAAEAEKALIATLERAANVLSAAAPVTTPVKSGSRQLYRARFAGFDPQAALNACQELKRRHIECFVAKAE